MPKKKAAEYELQDVWTETDPRGYRVLEFFIDSKTGLTSKYDNLSKFVGWNEARVKSYARKHGKVMVRKTVRISKTPRSEILRVRSHPIGDLQVVEEKHDKHVLYFKANGRKCVKIISDECGFLLMILADKIVAAWNDADEKEEATDKFDYIRLLGGIQHVDLETILSAKVANKAKTGKKRP